MKDFIIVGNFPDSATAHVAKGLLEAHGIECFLENEGLINRDPLMSVGYGGINLLVREKDAAKAQKILKD